MILNRENQTLLLDGVCHTSADCLRLAAEADERATPMLHDLYHFLADWFSESPLITVQTSGSTGIPKQYTVRKEQMMQSARLTCQFLGLTEGDRALLCMPLTYIAGKMVVVRALVAGLDLTVRTPSSHPLADVDEPLQFAAMIPLQVHNSLRAPEERRRLEQIDTLIVGGGAIDSSLEEELRPLPGTIYSTYGMTETLSHIALRRLNGPDASTHYHPFAGVGLSLSPEGTLTIHAPLVCDEILVTNDMAQLYPDGTFTILGRKDNVINTGGIKVQAEQVEAVLRPYLKCPFAITSVPDVRLGEAIVLLLESSGIDPLPGVNELPRYHRPKHILRVSSLPMTGSGKTDRAGCKKLAATLFGASET